MPVANNFWGKDDAGLQPMLDRMHASKVTSDELKVFYSGASISIEKEFLSSMLIDEKCELPLKMNMPESSKLSAASPSDQPNQDLSVLRWTWSAGKPSPLQRHTLRSLVR